MAALVVVPYLILYSPRRKESAGCLVIGLVFLLGWILFGVGAFASQAIHEMDWLAKHPRGSVVTEEEFMAMGDYPNVLAGVIMIGWAAAAVGMLIASWIGRRRRRTKEGVA